MPSQAAFLSKSALSGIDSFPSLRQSSLLDISAFIPSDKKIKFKPLTFASYLWWSVNARTAGMPLGSGFASYFGTKPLNSTMVQLLATKAG